MKRRIKIISFLVAVVVLFSAVVITCTAKSIYTLDGYSYSILSSSTVSVCGWDNRSSDLVIPREINNRYVAEIDDLAFQNNTVLTSVDMTPALLLNRIGVYAFSGCENLGGSVILSGRLDSIGESAFENCTSLEGVYFYTNNLSVINAQCFAGCSSLTEVLLPDGLTQIEKYAFADCVLLSEITIPNSVTSINVTAFNNIPDLVICCYTDSYAHLFAEENHINYVLLDAPEPPTEPTEPETEPPTEPEPVGYLLGDTDGNEYVDVVDATWVQRAVAEMDVSMVEATLMHGNVDGDDGLTVIDATFIMRYNVSIDTPYAIGERIV